ncbi:MAG TPA: hypothetical protein VL463_27270 [Kofleriaceae bacterium]|nr:hypothetical protein [Kofleriaceae bacterium]
MTARVPAPIAEPPEALVDRVLAGAPGAWASLAEAVHAEVLDVCRRRRWGAGSPHAADLHREVALRVLEKLHGNDYAALRAWAAARDRYPDARFGAWLGAVASNAQIDQLRASPEFARRRDGAARKTDAIATAELGDHASTAIDPARAAEIARVVRALAADDFPAEQRAAIALWLRGHDARAIAGELGLAGADAADKLLHAARERLRRAVRRPGGTHG